MPIRTSTVWRPSRCNEGGVGHPPHPTGIDLFEPSQGVVSLKRYLSLDDQQPLARQRLPSSPFLVCLVLGPFLVFAPQLAAATRTGLREYGTLAERYVREFDAKWLRGRVPADEPLVGSADIQSLADLGNSFDMVKTMRLAPITKDALVGLVIATLAPIVPLALTMVSLQELLKRLLGVLFWQRRAWSGARPERRDTAVQRLTTGS